MDSMVNELFEHLQKTIKYDDVVKPVGGVRFKKIEEKLDSEASKKIKELAKQAKEALSEEDYGKLEQVVADLKKVKDAVDSIAAAPAEAPAPEAPADVPPPAPEAPAPKDEELPKGEEELPVEGEKPAIPEDEEIPVDEEVPAVEEKKEKKEKKDDKECKKEDKKCKESSDTEAVSKKIAADSERTSKAQVNKDKKETSQVEGELKKMSAQEGKVPEAPMADTEDTIKTLTEKEKEEEPKEEKEEPKEEKEEKGEKEEKKDKKDKKSFELDEKTLEKIFGEVPELKSFDLEQVKKGIEDEKEHVDVTDGDPITTAKIALAHLKELPDYYTRLDAMLASAKEEQQAPEDVPAAVPAALEDQDLPPLPQGEEELPIESKKEVKEASDTEAMAQKIASDSDKKSAGQVSKELKADKASAEQAKKESGAGEKATEAKVSEEVLANPIPAKGKTDYEIIAANKSCGKSTEKDIKSVSAQGTEDVTGGSKPKAVPSDTKLAVKPSVGAKSEDQINAAHKADGKKSEKLIATGAKEAKVPQSFDKTEDFVQELTEDVSLVAFSDEDAAKAYATANKAEAPRKNDKSGMWEVMIKKLA